MIKIILLTLIGLLLSNCKDDKPVNNFTDNLKVIDSVNNRETASVVKTDKKDSASEKQSFVFSCGTECAIVFEEITRKINKNSVEIKYTITQYIHDTVENESVETYVFEADDNGNLISIHTNKNHENILNDDHFFGRKKFLEIGIELFPKGLISNSVFKKFEFEHVISKLETNEDYKYLIKMSLINKETKRVQNIDFTPEALYSKSRIANSSSHSYFNPKQNLIKTSEGIEKYHDLIVLDFNFDGLEDFAIINYEGSNGGPQYAYYKQNLKGQFELDLQLTNDIRLFPIEINNKEKTLKFSHPSGCCQMNTFIMKIQTNGKWKETYSKLDDI